MAARPVWADVAVGFGVVLAAAVVGWQTTAIPQAAIYAQVGPTTFPWIVAGLLALLGALLAAQGLLGGWPHEHEHEFDGAALAWLVLGLVLNVVLIDGLSVAGLGIVPKLGFILASTILFACTARAFGSRRVLRDGAVGFLLALTAYAGFDRLLGYRIGTGLIESLF